MLDEVNGLQVPVESNSKSDLNELPAKKGKIGSLDSWAHTLDQEDELPPESFFVSSMNLKAVYDRIYQAPESK